MPGLARRQAAEVGGGLGQRLVETRGVQEQPLVELPGEVGDESIREALPEFRFDLCMDLVRSLCSVETTDDRHEAIGHEDLIGD